MKFGFASIFFVGGGVLLDTARAQTTYPCPPAGTSTILPISPTTESTTIRLPKISNSNGLCILLRRSAADGNRRAHIARSYGDKHWERAAGRFAKPTSGVAVDCDAGSEHECDVTLPALQDGEEFVLESYDTPPVSSMNEAARFLEQATFGGSLQDIQALAATGNDFHSWLNDQINVKPTSSIRAFYRSHTNPKFEFPYNTGAVSVLPCEQYSRWRRYAITSRDCLKERKTHLQKHLEVKSISGVGYGFFVDDQFRTYTTSRPTFGWGDNTYVKLNYRYRIGSSQEANWKRDCVGCPVILWDAELGQLKFLHNPEVKFSGVPSSINPYNAVNLPELNSIDFPSIDNGEDWPVFETWVHPNEDALLNTTSLEDTNQCDDFPNFHIPLPHDKAGAPKGAFSTVFGKTPSGIEFAYDPHLALLENTVENPLPDGGGKLSIATQGLWRGSGTGTRTPGEQVMCQNLEKDFINEAGCKLSYLKEACSPMQYPDEMIHLDQSTVAGLRQMTSKDVYIVENLEIDDTLHSSEEGAPCGDGAQISRWILDENNLSCTSQVALGDETVHMFRTLIDARGESEVPNAQLVDVRKAAFPNGLQCSVADKTKTRFGSISSSDGTCWRHVHYQEHSVVDFSGRSDIQNYVTPGSSFVSVQVGNAPVIGRYGDYIVDNLDWPFDSQAITDAFKTITFNPLEGPVLVCGSPEEVGSDQFNGDYGFDVVTPENEGFREKSIWELSSQRHSSWTELALHAKDSLRQRMAWSLSQIIAVGLPGSGMVSCCGDDYSHFSCLCLVAYRISPPYPCTLGIL